MALIGDPTYTKGFSSQASTKDCLQNETPQNNAATGRKRAPGGAAGMQQCQNHWQAWHILQFAQSRRSGRKEEKLREKSGKLRCRCGFTRTQAFKHAWRGIFCRARSPGGRAGSRKNCKQNPANCAAAVLSRTRRRFSMGVWT